MKSYVSKWARTPLAAGLALAAAVTAKATIGDEGAYLACQHYWPDHFAQNSEWGGNCGDSTRFVYADDLVRDVGAGQTQYPLVLGLSFVILRADEPELSPEQRCAIEQNLGVAIEGGNFDRLDEATAYFINGIAPYVNPSSQGIDEPVPERDTWGKIKSLFK